MADSQETAHIRAYLEQHRATYDREALRQKLLADGHNREAVELAMAQVYGLQVAPQPAPASGSTVSRYWLLILGVVLLNVMLLPASIVVTVNSELAQTALALLAGGLAPVIVVLLLETGAILYWRRTRPQLSRALLIGVGASLGMVVPLALLFGACVALIMGIGG
jgi:hypothetical protein